jgi:DoxX-like family
MSTTEAATPSKSDGPLRASLWVAQSLIFLAFGLAGLMKIFMPIPGLASMWPWTGDLPAPIVRILGAIDIAGGVGVLLPALTRVKPDLTVLAALGCVALQICAMIFHISRGETAATPVNLVLLTLAIFVFWGRLRMPLAPR